MCLILYAYRCVPGYPLIVAANRDENHARATAGAGLWQDHPQVIAGRDLEAGGTWLGVTRQGRFAALTNFPQADGSAIAGVKSRGELVSGFLAGREAAADYAQGLQGEDYAGYNLLLFDGNDLIYTSNRDTTRKLAPGYYGLSNAELGVNWPKCNGGAQVLQTLVSREHRAEDVLAMLADRSAPPDDQLPDRGRPIEMERQLGARFILGEGYGTRASTVLYLGEDNLRFIEQSYLAGGQADERTEFNFRLEDSNA